MAKDTRTGGYSGTTGSPSEQEKTGNPVSPGEPVPGTPTSPPVASTATAATNGGTNGPKSAEKPVEPEEPARKPRQTQPMQLAQLIQSEETLARIKGSLPKHLTPERWISVLLTVNSGSPELQRCDPRSILRAALQAAVLGLDLNKTMKEAYLIPRSYEKADAKGQPVRDDRGRIITFWEATFMPGYAGLRKLVMNGGDVLNVRSALVYKSELEGTNGLFLYQFSPDLEFLHKPAIDARGRGEVALAYAIAKLKTGEHVIEVMTIDEVEQSGHHRSSIYLASRKPGGRESGPWVSDYPMMVRKTVLKRLCGQLPMNPEAQAAIDIDNQSYVSSVTTSDSSGGRRAIEVIRRGRGSRTLADRLDGLQADRTGLDDDIDPLDDDDAVVDTGAGDNQDLA